MDPKATTHNITPQEDAEIRARLVNIERVRKIAEDYLYGEGFYTQAERVNEAIDLIETMKQALWEASNALSHASHFLPRTKEIGQCATPYEVNQMAQDTVLEALRKLDEASAY